MITHLHDHSPLTIYHTECVVCVWCVLCGVWYVCCVEYVVTMVYGVCCVECGMCVV